MEKIIIFVTGGPGTGKSYASDFLIKHLNPVDLVSYDQIKEKEWDRFGFDNAKQKDRLNWFSLEEFYLTLQKKCGKKKISLQNIHFIRGTERNWQNLWMSISTVRLPFCYTATGKVFMKEAGNGITVRTGIRDT